MAPYIGSSPAESALTTGDLGNNIVDGTKTKDALIADYSDVTITAADLLMYGDATDSNNTKRDTVQGILDLGGGAWNLIGTSVASSSASLTQTGLDSTYDTYAVILSDCVPATDNQNPWFRFGDSSGIDSSSSDYRFVVGAIYANTTTGAVASDESTGEAQMRFADSAAAIGGVGNASGEGVSGTFYIGQPGDSTMQTTMHGTFSFWDGSTVLTGGFFMGGRNAVITCDRVQFLFASGNIATGRMTVWGLAHA
jgi:hypothetical protein